MRKKRHFAGRDGKLGILDIRLEEMRVPISCKSLAGRIQQ